MAQEKKITLSLTPKQMEDFLQQFVCKVAIKEAKKKLEGFKVTEKAGKSTKPELKKQNSSVDFSKMNAGDVAALAQKKAKKAKDEIKCKGKKPTKKENVAYLTDGESTDSSKKAKKPSSKELEKFTSKVNAPKKFKMMELSELKNGAKLDGFAKCHVNEIRAVAMRIAALQEVSIPSKNKLLTKAEYLAFATGKVKGVKEGKGKGKGKGKTPDPDSEEDSPSSDDDSDSFSSCTDSSDSDSSDSDID
jgi:hypothetical protein